MMGLLFVGDGPTDKATIPYLVSRILGQQVEVGDFSSWKDLRLNQGAGYGRKLRFALEKVRDSQFAGLVATLDCDRARPKERLQELQASRELDRQDPAFLPVRTALGEAIPHLEAWLIDDPKAVREILGFSRDREIPNVKRVDPKATLNQLIDESERRHDDRMPLLSEIAQQVDARRCNHKSDTGFEDFIDDVTTELR